MKKHPGARVPATTWIFLAEVAVLLVLGHLFAEPLHNDQRLYVSLGTSLAEGHGYGSPGRPTAFVPPGYPIVVAQFVELFGSQAIPAIRSFHMVLLAVAAWLCQDMLGLLGFGLRARVLAQVGVAFYPASIRYASLILTDVVFAFLLVLLFWTVIRILKERDPARPSRSILWAALAFFLALGALAVRPTGLFFTAALLLAGAGIGILNRHARRRWALVVLAVLLGNLAFVSIWGMRNQRVLGTFVPFSTSGGWVIYIGNCVVHGGDCGRREFAELVGPVEYERVMKLPEVEQNRVFMGHFVDQLKDNGAAMLGLWPKKLARFWFNLGYRDAPSPRSFVLAGVNLALLVLGFLGAWSLLRGPTEPLTKWWAFFAVVFILVMTGAHLLMLAIVRYAFPTFLVLLLLAAVAVDRLLGRSRIGNEAS